MSSQSQFSTQLFFLPFVFLLLLAIIYVANGGGGSGEKPNKLKSSLLSRSQTFNGPKLHWSNSMNNRQLELKQSFDKSKSKLTYSKSIQSRVAQNSKNFKATVINGDKKSYIEFIMPPYGSPEPFSRIVKIGKNKNGGKWLVSSDPSMQSILEFVQEKLGTEHPKLKAVFEQEEGNSVETFPKKGCHVSFHFDSRIINEKVSRFDIGTRVSEESIAHLELFEEQGTGRKMIINKSKAEKEIANTKEDATDDEDDDEDEDEDEEDEQNIPLNTYASLSAIQRGPNAFVQDARLDMSNIPKKNVLTNKKLINRVKKFFDKIIEACDGNDKEQSGKKGEATFRSNEPFDLKDLLDRMKTNEGKMQSKEDMDKYMEDLNEIMDKMVYSVRSASEYERAEIRTLAEEKKREFEEETKWDHEVERASLLKEEYHPYEFLKTVQFAINARPAFIEFKKLTFTEYEELIAISEEWGKLKQTLNWLKIEQKLKDNDVKILLEKAAEGFEKFDNVLGAYENLNNEDKENLKDAVKWPKLEDILAVPLNEQLDRKECQKLMELAAPEKLNEFNELVMKLKKQKKLNNEEFEKLKATNGDHSKLKKLIEDVIGPEYQSIADNLINGKKNVMKKAYNWTKENGKKMGISFYNGIKWFGKLVGARKSREITSSEMEKMKEKNANNQKLLQQARREAIDDAVKKIQQNRKCHLLSEPIRFAIYGEETSEKKHNLKSNIASNEQKEEEKSGFQLDHENERKAAATEDLRARLGAQAMNAVLNTKRYPEGHGMALAMSLMGSGGIGILLDVLLIPLFVMGATNVFGPIPYVGVAMVIIIKYIIKPLLESSTPMAAETFDSAIIKQYLDSLKGKKFWRGLKHFKKSLVEAFESGKIAALGSILYNFSMLASFPGSLPIQMFLNGISTIASAAMVPIELMKTRDEIIKSLHYKMKEVKFFPKPSEQEQDIMAIGMQKDYEKLWKRLFVKKPLHQKMQQEEKRNWAYMDWLEKQSWRTMEVQQSSRLAINSMGIGPILSSIVFLLMHYFQSATHTPEGLVNGVSVMVNSPTEMISLTGAIYGANSIGFEFAPWLLSTDEQKNGLIMGAIFEKSHQQMKNGNFMEIEDDQMHRIYNPRLAITMPMGKFFVKSGIWLKKKWDRFSQWHKYTRDENNTKTGIRGLNPNKLIVENYRKDVVYLITFPRINSLPTLSPKSMALEYWLKMHNIQFYRITDGFFMTDLFANKIPYVELNGKKFEGSIQQIIDSIVHEMKFGNVAKHSNEKELAHLLTQLENALVSDRKKHGMEFMLRDKALLTGMLSSMSQLFPDLAEYELDYIDSWDTLPGPLKGTFNLMSSKTDTKLAELSKELKKMEVNLPHKLINEGGIIEIMKKIEEILNNAKNSSHNKHYLAGSEPSYLDGYLFGLLTQFFETPSKQLKNYFAGHKNSNSILWKYYGQMAEEITGQNNLWRKRKDHEEPLPLNFDLMPAEAHEKPEIDVVNKGKNVALAIQADEHSTKEKFHADTDKYEGQFSFKFAHFLNGKRISDIHKEEIKKLTGLTKITSEQPVPIGLIKAEMHATKVNHSWLGPLWKVPKEWGDVEFAVELERRVAEYKREHFLRQVHERILMLPEAEKRESEEKKDIVLAPVMAAVVDRLLHTVWEWTKPMQQEVMHSIEHIDNLDKAAHELGEKISKIFNEYVEKMSEKSKELENEVDNQVYKKFMDLDKSRELFDKLGREAVNKRVDEFYDQELKDEILKLLGHEKTLSSPIQEGEVEIKIGKMDQQSRKNKEIEDKYKGTVAKEKQFTIDKNKANTKEKVEEIIRNIQTPTIKELDRRVRHIFDQVVSGHLSDAAEYAKSFSDEFEKKAETSNIAELSKNAEIHKNAEISENVQTSTFLTIEEHFEKIIQEMLPNKKGLKPEMHKCIRNFFKMQRDAIEYIRKNNGRIGTDKSRLSTQDRLFRMFDRYIDMKKVLSEKCPKELEFHLFAKVRPNVDENEASSSSSMIGLEHERRTIKMSDILKMFNDRKLKKEFSKKREELRKVFDELEERRMKKLDQVVSIYTFNERTKELVKAKIEATNLVAQREKIEAKLGEEGTDMIRNFLDNRIGLAQTRGQSFTQLRKELAAEMQKIAGLQAKCVKDMYLTLSKKTEIIKCNEILNDVIKKYERIKQIIDNQFYATAYDKDPVKNEINKKIDEIKEIFNEIEKLYAKYQKTGKQLILEGIGSITADKIRSEAKLEKFKIFSLKWETKMAKEEAARKWERMNDELLKKQLDDSSLWQPLESGLNEIRLKIFALDHGTRISEVQGNKTAILLSKLGEIGDEKCRDIIKEEVGKIYNKELEQRRMEMIRSVKYPIAKGILHLVGAYLCEGEHCKEEHMEMAKKELAEISKGKNVELELLPAVKKLVFYTIGDFNENGVIREEILEQFGIPLEKAVMKAYSEKPFWDTENYRAEAEAAEKEEKQKEVAETMSEDEHHLQHNAGKAKGKAHAGAASSSKHPTSAAASHHQHHESESN